MLETLGRLDIPSVVFYTGSRRWDPFNRNVLKGDYPIAGRSLFFNFTGASETILATRRIPVPAGPNTTGPNASQFFGRGGQFGTVQNFRLSFDLFRGSAGFQPVDFEIRVTPEFNINYALTRENGLVSVNVAWAEKQGGLAAFIDRVDGLVEIVAIHHELMDAEWDLIRSRLPLDRLCVWTINDEPGIRHWLERGIGSLTSDSPDLALKLRDGIAA